MKISDFSVHLRNGAGDGNPRDGLCLMQAVHWFSGADHLSDHPECASPVLCAVGIQLNDLAPSQEHRDRLWPLVWQLLDSRDPTSEQARVEHVVREVTRRIVAPIFDKIELRDHADALKRAQSMPEIKSAAETAAAAAAMAWAEDASDAAISVAWAAWGPTATAWAAEAAAWEELRAIFVEAITLGKHGNADPIYVPRAVKLSRILQDLK